MVNENTYLILNATEKGCFPRRQNVNYCGPNQVHEEVKDPVGQKKAIAKNIWLSKQPWAPPWQS